MCRCADVSELEKVAIAVVEVANSRKSCCDVCAKKKFPPVIFCIDCERRFCGNHRKEHDNFFERFQSKVHKSVSIKLYEESPKKYLKDKCLTHTEEVTHHACRACWKIFCSPCAIGLPADCPETNGYHQIVKLKDVAEEQREIRRRELSTLPQIIDEMVKAEKEAIKDSESVEKEADKFRQEISDASALQVSAQISILEKQADSMAESIKMQRHQSLEDINDFMNYIASQKCLITAAEHEGFKEIEGSSDVEFLRKRKASGSLTFNIKPYRKAFRSSVTELKGEILQVLPVPAPIFDISVLRNELAVCNGDQGIKMYRIQRSFGAQLE